MEMLESLVLLVHVLAALAIIGLVLLQQGKGAEMGSGFGAGASATVFGSAGSGNFLTRTTTVLALTFFLTSFGLAYIAKERAANAGNIGLPALEVEAPVPADDFEVEVPAETRAEVPDTPLDPQ